MLATSTSARSDSIPKTVFVRWPERVWGEHRPFLVAVVLAAAIRVVVQLAFTPALLHSDGPGYMATAYDPHPRPDRPVGYSLYLLYPIVRFTDNLTPISVVQHLIGLATAICVYVLLRRWGVGAWVATLGTLPVLFDSMQLVLEQTVLSDTLFDLFLVLGLLLLGWLRRPTLAFALAAGVFLGLAATVRLVGEPLVLAGVGYCLLASPGWRARLATAAAVTLGFAVPVGAYATWYHQEEGVFALAEFGGRSLYMRTTTFVICKQLSIPDYERVLCPREKLGDRLNPGFYGWGDDKTLPRLFPPRGIRRDDALHDFAMKAIRDRPVSYIKIAIRDFVLNFDLKRNDRYEFTAARKWWFSTYIDWDESQKVTLAYATYGGRSLTAREPYARFLTQYQRFGYLPGPLLLGCLILGLLGGVGIGRARTSGLRSICLLLTLTGTGLMLVPAVSAYFTWRYQLPAVVVLPAAAALGFTALRGRQDDDETVATPSTD